MPYTYLLNTQERWNSFFRALLSKDITRLSMFDLEIDEPMIIDKLKDVNAKPIYDVTISGRRYIKGCEFEAEEDLLYFKLKFN